MQNINQAINHVACAATLLHIVSFRMGVWENHKKTLENLDVACKQ